MFCLPWLFSLFGVIIPLEEMVFFGFLIKFFFQTKFYDNFVENGWTFFYQVLIAYLNKKKELILDCDACEILEILTKDNYKKFHSEKEVKEQRVFWRNVLRNAETVDINQEMVKYLHSAYNSEKKVFKI